MVYFINGIKHEGYAPATKAEDGSFRRSRTTFRDLLIAPSWQKTGIPRSLEGFSAVDGGQRGGAETTSSKEGGSNLAQELATFLELDPIHHRQAFPAERDRYHLFLAQGCPWAHRCAIAVKELGLKDFVSISYCDPRKTDEEGWELPQTPSVAADCRKKRSGENEAQTGQDVDGNKSHRYLWEKYLESDTNYTGHISTPVLWDKLRQKIVNNESAEILRILNHAFRYDFDSLHNKINLSPRNLQDRISEINAMVYENVNNAVYEAGFARTDEAYEKAFLLLFNSLDTLEQKLSKSRYLCGDSLTEADIRLWVTLIRFDSVYYIHFKCNRNFLADYHSLSNYTRDIFQRPGIASTVDFQQIQEHYYWSHDSINPQRKIPLDFKLATQFMAPHDRDKFTRLTTDGGSNGAADKKYQTKDGMEESQHSKKERQQRGEFVRGVSAFRHKIEDRSQEVSYTKGNGDAADNETAEPLFPPEAGRYHLYVAHNCPWCHRCVLTRAVKGLTDIVSMDVLYYRRDPERGWQFNPDEPGCTKDTVNGFKFIQELYEFEGSAEKSVPVLYDKVAKRIVNNESAEIIRMFNSVFDSILDKEGREGASKAPRQEADAEGSSKRLKITPKITMHDETNGASNLKNAAPGPVFFASKYSSNYRFIPDLFPKELQLEIEYMNSWIYPEINNGAYKAGFTSDQELYKRACVAFFNALEKVELVLRCRRFLCGYWVTEADIRLFPTIFRFDAVYYIRMKLTRKMIREFPHIQRWLEDMWFNVPGVRGASNLSHARRGYFGRTGNNIVPLGPALDKATGLVWNRPCLPGADNDEALLLGEDRLLSDL